MRVVGTLVLAVSFTTGAAGQTIQELGLPTPVKFEAVVPHIVFGNAGLFHFATEVTLINGTNDTAFVEFELLDSQGAAALHLVGEDGSSREGRPGVWETIQEANSVLRLRFPRFVRERLILPEGIFDGWALIRSNTPLTASSAVFSGESGRDDISSAATVVHGSGVRTIDSFSNCSRNHTYDADPIFGGGVANGWFVRDTGVVVVNPHAEPMTVRIGHRNLTVEARSKQAVRALTSLLLLCSSSSNARSFQAESVAGLPFSFINFTFSYYTDLKDRTILFRTKPAIELERERYQRTEAAGFDLPVPIVDQLNVGDLEIFLTWFGLLVKSPDSEIFTLNLNGAEGLHHEPEAGIVVALGSWQSLGLVFTTSGKAIPVGLDSTHGSVLEVTMDETEIRIRFGDSCINHIIRVDRVRQELIDVDLGDFCF